MIHSALLIVIMTLMTMVTRFLPFVLFRDSNKLPKSMVYLGSVLPGAIMGMLVVYCFKTTTVLSWPFAMPEIIASAVVIATYIWRKNVLLSIVIGTVLYMLFVQVIFV